MDKYSIDLETGEVLVKDKEMALRKSRKTNNNFDADLSGGLNNIKLGRNFTARWSKVDSALMKLIYEGEENYSVVRVYFALLDLARFGNFVDCTLAKLSDMTSIPIPTVSLAIKKLVEIDLVVKAGERGKYLLNPLYSFKGSAESIASALGAYKQFKSDARKAKKAKAKELKTEEPRATYNVVPLKRANG